MRTIADDDNNNNDEIHLKNDPFNIQVDMFFIIDKTLKQNSLEKEWIYFFQ